MKGILLRAADSSDLPRLLAVVENSPGAPQWSVSTWQQVLESSAGAHQRLVLIAECGAGAIGFGVIGLAGNDAEIETLAVASPWRRRGVARKICEYLIQWAHTRGAERVLLEVRVSNDAARNLYESLCFRAIALRRAYYKDPVEDAVVMALKN